MQPKRWQDSATETVQVVLPNDSNPLGFILGGTVMHLIDITGAIACHRHTNSLALTAAVDGLEFVHTIRVGDMIILKSRVTGTFTTSLEVEVEVFSEAVTTGERRLTSRAYLTFVAIDREGRPQPVPPLLLETDDDRRRSDGGARAARRAPGAQARAPQRRRDRGRRDLAALGRAWPQPRPVSSRSRDAAGQPRQPHLAASEVEGHAVRAQEAVADDAARAGSRAARSARAGSAPPPRSCGTRCRGTAG